MSRFTELNALQTGGLQPKSPVPGLIRSLEDAQHNEHPQPILVHPLWFRTMCVECGGVAVGPQRSTLAVALVDRIKHQESHP